MTDDPIRRDDDASADAKDSHLDAIRDLPRLRSVEELTGERLKEHTPPTPMVSRIGGLTQGCGGVLLAIMGIVMLMAALWYEFYMWGPGLLLVGGVLLVGGTMGVWRGRQTPIFASLVILVGMAIVGYFWSSFVQPAGALSPLGGLGVIFSLGSMAAVIALLITFVTNALSLGIYWRRLVPVSRRSLAVWAIVAAVMAVAVLALHFTQQQQRKAWLEDRLSSWSAQAQTDSLTLGTSTNITLGYTFVTIDEGDDPQLDLRLAELDSALEAGSGLVRVSASGDMLFEADTPRMFVKNDGEDAEGQQKAADRIARQAANESEYMGRLTGSDAKLLLADAQYTPYMLVWANDESDIPWDTFTTMQEQRVRHYAELYKPAAYEIVNEPSAYKQYSAIAEPEDADMLGLWLTQTEALIAAVNEISPDTQVGVTVALENDFDMQYYERILTLDGVDFVGFRMFNPGGFDSIENVFSEHGNAIEHGKQVWIMETWYGYCLAPQRSMKLDGMWLQVAAAFAAKEQFAGVLESDFGCFLQPGGTLFQSVGDLTGRTDVWKTWQTLVAQWQPGE